MGGRALRNVHGLESAESRNWRIERTPGQTGSYIPFATTKKARIESQDPRLSVEERYSSEAEYLLKIRDAGISLAKSGFLLERDIPAVVNTAERYWDWSTQPARASRD